MVNDGDTTKAGWVGVRSCEPFCSPCDVRGKVEGMAKSGIAYSSKLDMDRQSNFYSRSAMEFLWINHAVFFLIDYGFFLD